MEIGKEENNVNWYSIELWKLVSKELRKIVKQGIMKISQAENKSNW